MEALGENRNKRKACISMSRHIAKILTSSSPFLPNLLLPAVPQL